METPILILEDALNQQREQLSKSIKNAKPKNEKQKLLYDKAHKNLRGFIAEIEEALNILKPNEPKTVSNNECEKKCENCGSDKLLIYCEDCYNAAWDKITC